jgi:hypothetical protein
MPEDELLCLTKGLTYALYHLSTLEAAHGQLDTANVFFDVDYFIYRVYDNELINGQNSGYRRFCAQQGQISQTGAPAFAFLAPELLA